MRPLSSLNKSSTYYSFLMSFTIFNLPIMYYFLGDGSPTRGKRKDAARNAKVCVHSHSGLQSSSSTITGIMYTLASDLVLQKH